MTQYVDKLTRGVDTGGGPQARGGRNVQHPEPAEAAPRHRPGGISLLMEWWTIHHRGALLSLARDARRSHRSVEGDDLSHVCVCERHTAKTPHNNIRGFYFTAISGLGRFGLGRGWPRQRLRAPSSCRPPGPRSCQLARCPRTLPPPLRRPLCPSWRAGFSPIPTKSGASKASGWILGSWDRRRPGPASAASRSLQKIVGVIVGTASRTGREHLQGSSPPESTEGLSPRVRGNHTELGCNLAVEALSHVYPLSPSLPSSSFVDTRAGDASTPRSHLPSSIPSSRSRPSSSVRGVRGGSCSRRFGSP